jgi:hypothetical protein
LLNRQTNARTRHVEAATTTPAGRRETYHQKRGVVLLHAKVAAEADEGTLNVQAADEIRERERGRE